MDNFEDFFNDEEFDAESSNKFQNWQNGLFDLNGFDATGVELTPEKIEVFDEHAPGLLHLRKKTC